MIPELDLPTEMMPALDLPTEIMPLARAEDESANVIKDAQRTDLKRFMPNSPGGYCVYSGMVGSIVESIL
jgi:hypothetical protein